MTSNDTEPTIDSRAFVLLGGNQVDPKDLLKYLLSLTTQSISSSTQAVASTSKLTTTVASTLAPTTTPSATTTTTLLSSTSKLISAIITRSTEAATSSLRPLSVQANSSFASTSTPAASQLSSSTLLSSTSHITTRLLTSSSSVAEVLQTDSASGVGGEAGGLPEGAHRMYPVFCSKNTVLECFDTPLNQCRACDSASSSAFLAVVVILGFLILLSNLTVLEVVRRKRKRGKVDNMDLHRVSLAVADLLTGIQLVVVPLYNYAWMMRSTSLEVAERSVELYDSTAAKFGGSFFVLTFAASLFNLLYLAAQRLYAFVRPIQYKFQGKRVVCVGLLITWLVAVVSCTIPAWIPHEIAFNYFAGTFLFSPQQRPGTGMTASITLFTIFYVLPYFVTVVMILLSACIVSKHIRKSSKPATNYSPPKNDQSAAGETPFFITTAVMVIGFTLTTIPLFGVLVFQYATGSTDVDSAYVICFYVTMSNSLVNVVVYSIRDTSFRVMVREIFCGVCRPCSSQEEAMGGRSKRKQLRSTSESYTNTGTSSAGRSQSRSTP